MSATFEQLAIGNVFTAHDDPCTILGKRVVSFQDGREPEFHLTLRVISETPSYPFDYILPREGVS